MTAWNCTPIFGWIKCELKPRQNFFGMFNAWCIMYVHMNTLCRNIGYSCSSVFGGPAVIDSRPKKQLMLSFLLQFLFLIYTLFTPWWIEAVEFPWRSVRNWYGKTMSMCFYLKIFKNKNSSASSNFFDCRLFQFLLKLSVHQLHKPFLLSPTPPQIFIVFVVADFMLVRNFLLVKLSFCFQDLHVKIK